MHVRARSWCQHPIDSFYNPQGQWNQTIPLGLRRHVGLGVSSVLGGLRHWMQTTCESNESAKAGRRALDSRDLKKNPPKWSLAKPNETIEDSDEIEIGCNST
jgi:hypothetical protein